MVNEIKDGDYYLVDGAGWFEYNGLVVRIFNHKEMGCLQVSTFVAGHEDEDPIFLTQCFEYPILPEKR